MELALFKPSLKASLRIGKPPSHDAAAPSMTLSDWVRPSTHVYASGNYNSDTATLTTLCDL
jgi:hypothetical protein